MRKKFYQTERFKELSKQWEELLEQEGLADIEKVCGGQSLLKQQASNVYRQMDKDSVEAKEIYFRRLGEIVCQTSFESFVDLTVMNLKSHGARIREICEILARWGCRKHRGTIRLIIRRYENQWGIRKWRPDQLKWQWYHRKKRRQAIR